jgi:peptidoglycan/xylan/chitin deacetylase (PgdA/CDA1 family)
MGDVIVLCYHAVSPSWTAPLSVTPEALEHQLRAMLRRGWRPATFADAVLAPSRENTFAVTFDDAFASVRELAFPIMSALEIPGTVFAPTAFMDERQPLCWPGIDHWQDTPAAVELVSMSWEDLRELAREGWEIGSHTRTHPRLPGLDDDALTDELGSSREEISRRLGRACRTVAYPYGVADERVADHARAAGYSAGAVLSRRLFPLGLHRWPRIGVYHTDRSLRFSLKASRGWRTLRRTNLWPADKPASRVDNPVTPA